MVSSEALMSSHWSTVPGALQAASFSVLPRSVRTADRFPWRLLVASSNVRLETITFSKASLLTLMAADLEGWLKVIPLPSKTFNFYLARQNPPYIRVLHSATSSTEENTQSLQDNCLPCANQLNFIKFPHEYNHTKLQWEAHKFLHVGKW